MASPASKLQSLLAPALLLGLVVPTGCKDSGTDQPPRITVAWNDPMYEGWVNVAEVAQLNVRASGTGDGDYVLTSVVVPGTEDPSDIAGVTDNRRIDSPSGDGLVVRYDVPVLCTSVGDAELLAQWFPAGAGTAYQPERTEVDRVPLSCIEAPTPTSSTGTDTGSNPDTGMDTATGGTGGTTMTPMTTGGSDESSGGGTGGADTGGGPACGMGMDNPTDAMGVQHDEVTVTGTMLTGELTGNAGPCPEVLCTVEMTSTSSQSIDVHVGGSLQAGTTTLSPIDSTIDPMGTLSLDLVSTACDTPDSTNGFLSFIDASSTELGTVDITAQTTVP